MPYAESKTFRDALLFAAINTPIATILLFISMTRIDAEAVAYLFALTLPALFVVSPGIGATIIK